MVRGGRFLIKIFSKNKQPACSFSNFIVHLVYTNDSLIMDYCLEIGHELGQKQIIS